jgi:hypothetical protein
MARPTIARMALSGFTVAAVALITGCYATPATVTLDVPSTCTKTVMSGPVGGPPTTYTTTNLPDEDIKVATSAPAWVDASNANPLSDTFPFSFTVSGFTAGGQVPAGSHVYVTIQTDHAIASDPNLAATTDLSTDPTWVALAAIGFDGPLSATPGGPILYQSSAGTPFPAALVSHETTLGHTGFTPEGITFGGLYSNGPLTVVGGTQSLTSVACQPTGDPSQEILTTITPHVS